MNEQQERKLFEKWISSPPYELDVSRNSQYSSKAAFPDQYNDYNVQLAWKAWIESKVVHKSQK